MSKTNILLDLDQTLISAEASEEYDMDSSRANKFKYIDMDGYYMVFERPGLQTFLDYLFKNFNVSIWTAASKDYALFIVDKIILKKPGRRLDWIFFSYHCDISKSLKKGSKDLDMLWDEFKIPGYTRDNTIIIDDYDEVYNIQNERCIIAYPFEVTNEGSENDTYLTDLRKLIISHKGPPKAYNINKSIKELKK
jgi:TFIIF-interacting CTD phosphatase-like protein